MSAHPFHRRPRTFLLAGLLVAGACGEPSVAGDPLEPSFATVTVPDRTVIVTAGTVNPAGRCPVLTFSDIGTGRGTHLGLFTAEQSHCIDPGVDPLRATDGEFRFTMHDGSTLVGTYEFQVEPPTDPTAASFQGTYRYTGGTRRFEGASGGGSATGTANLVTGEAIILGEGTLTLPRGR